jgi:multiple sugar transport system permease protein
MREKLQGYAELPITKGRMLTSRTDRQNLLKGLSFLSPWIIGFTAFTVLPIALCIYYAFTDYSLLKPPLFRGLENFKTLGVDRNIFWKSLGVTAYFAVFALPLGLTISLALALLLNMKTRGQTIYRTIIFLPSLVPAVASAMLWLWILNPSLGMINIFLTGVWESFPVRMLIYVFRKVGIIFLLRKFKVIFLIHKLGLDHAPGWNSDVHWAMPSLVLMSLWGVGNTVIVYLAGLQDVPRELYEAADLDGAGPLGRIFHVTLPCISPVIFFNLIMAIIGSVQQFTNAFIITSPERATYFFTLAIYNKAFVDLHMGEACAMAIVQLLIILTLTAIAFWSSKKWVHYQGK